MNQKQVNLFGMYKSVMNHLDSNVAVWSGIIPITEKYNELKAILADLDEKIVSQQVKNTEGFTQAKYAAMETLVNLSYKMALKVKVFAKKVGDKVLLQSVDISESELGRGPATEVITRCQLIFNAASSNFASLLPYKITDKEINDLKQAIELASSRAVQRDTMYGERSSITEALVELYSQAQDDLDDLDDMIEALIDESHKDFIAGYFATRRVNNRRGRRSKKEEKQAEEKKTEAPVQE